MPDGSAERIVLSEAWVRVGGGFVGERCDREVDLEDLVARSAEAAPDDYRLFFVCASWLAVHARLVNGRRLAGRLTRLPAKARAAAGAMLSLAQDVTPASGELRRALVGAAPLPIEEPLFSMTARDPSLRMLAEAAPLPVFRRWGLLHHETSMKLSATRPVTFVLASAPELLPRALFGAGLASEIVEAARVHPLTLDALYSATGAPPHAVRRSGANLVQRGILRRAAYAGGVVELSSDFAVWLGRYPSLAERHQR